MLTSYSNSDRFCINNGNNDQENAEEGHDHSRWGLRNESLRIDYLELISCFSTRLPPYFGLVWRNSSNLCHRRPMICYIRWIYWIHNGYRAHFFRVCNSYSHPNRHVHRIITKIVYFPFEQYKSIGYQNNVHAPGTTHYLRDRREFGITKSVGGWLTDWATVIAEFELKTNQIHCCCNRCGGCCYVSMNTNMNERFSPSRGLHLEQIKSHQPNRNFRFSRIERETYCDGISITWAKRNYNKNSVHAATQFSIFRLSVSPFLSSLSVLFISQHERG